MASLNAFCEEANELSEINDGTIEVHYSSESDVSYREKRGSWSPLVSIGFDQIFPDQYTSTTSGLGYETLFGRSKITIKQATVGAKFNFSLAAISMDLTYGMGDVGDARSGQMRELYLTKKSASMGLYLDRLSESPYLIPYVKGQAFVFDYKEVNVDTREAKEGSSPTSFGAIAGLLISLNWMEEKASREVYQFAGVKNSFLDLFVSQYGDTGSGNNPQFQSSIHIGAGVTVEF